MKTALPALVALVLLLTPSSGYAVSMSNSSYILDVTNDISSPQPTATPEDEEVAPPITQNTKLISGDNYLVYLSYDDDVKNLPFLFSTSGDGLNFGKVIPGEPLIRTQSFTVLPNTSHGYQVVAFEDHVLQRDGASIPDVSCDAGNCTSILSDVWQNPLTYGFGYRCDNTTGMSCTTGFEQNRYKRFANDQAKETPQPVLDSRVGEKSESVISYKLNVAGNQPEKGYQNIIYYITVPSL